MTTRTVPGTVRPWVSGYRILLALSAYAAVGWDISHQLLLSGVDPVDALSYFTMLTNLFGATVLLWCALPVGSLRRDRFRGAAVVYLVVTGVVFATLMGGGQGLEHVNPWSNAVLHQIMPVALLLDWLINPPAERIPARRALWWLAFPVLYVAWTLVRGQLVDWYPYLFLDPRGPDGFAPVVQNIAGMTVAVTVLIMAVSWIGNLRRTASYKTSSGS
ncbi:Pr6Pr family membrane protein [Streptomyces exfoliatus]|uniref:Pr6Pr family membrane protein n=1 Tax=Streptomyces exfoliatus TaxID=1905 RepID=UPI00068D8976|nr:Pr6Pr family membrane protein [Streptomyces exfoliatus]